MTLSPFSWKNVISSFERLELVEVLPFESPLLTKLRHVEVEVVVADGPGRIEDEGRNWYFPFAELY